MGIIRGRCAGSDMVMASMEIYDRKRKCALRECDLILSIDATFQPLHLVPRPGHWSRVPDAAPKCKVHL